MLALRFYVQCLLNIPSVVGGQSLALIFKH
jgi:hypothetical protein